MILCRRNAMTQKLRKMYLSVVFAILLGCGNDVIIDVNSLPCGTARGNSASGEFTYSGIALDENCQLSAFTLYNILLTDQTVEVNHYEPNVEGCKFGRLEILFPATQNTPEFTLKGGIWSDGSFRVGQAVAMERGEIFRILFDGKFHSIEEGKPPQDHFSGEARVDIDTGNEQCTYRVAFSGTRVN